MAHGRSQQIAERRVAAPRPSLLRIGSRPRWSGPLELRRLGIGGPFLRPRLLLAGLLGLLLLWLATSSEDAGAGELGPCAPEEILYGIRQVESGGREDPPDGDDGLAIGPYQIHRAYWIDAGIPGRYQDCRDREYAERVVDAYMRRYVPEAWATGDAEIVARTHNGGPRGRFKRATDRYWARVRAVLFARQQEQRAEQQRQQRAEQQRAEQQRAAGTHNGGGS